MGVADELSHQTEEKTKSKCNSMKTEKAMKRKDGKSKRHVMNRDGKCYWRFDDGGVKEGPKEERRDQLISEIMKNYYIEELNMFIMRWIKNSIGLE